MIEIPSHTQSEAARPAPVIKVVGIGGAGSNVLDRVVLDGFSGAHTVAMNTDVQSLTSTVAVAKVRLGQTKTRGLGAGGDPELGYEAAEEAIGEIRAALSGAQMVFLCAGLGGGTGSGATPVVSAVAQHDGALVVALVTLPFTFEGKRRQRQAAESLEALRRHASLVICFENDRMGDAVAPTAGVHQAFAAADQTLSQAVRSLCEVFSGDGLIPCGLDEIHAALGGSGRCLFGFGESDGDNRAHDALTRALKSPLMERGKPLGEAHTVVANVTGGPDMTLHEVQTLMEELNRHTGDNTRVLFSLGVSPALGKRMRLLLLGSTGEPAAAAQPRAIAPPVAKPAQPAPTAREPEPEAVLETPVQRPGPAPEPVAAVEITKEPAVEPIPVAPTATVGPAPVVAETPAPAPRPVRPRTAPAKPEPVTPAAPAPAKPFPSAFPAPAPTPAPGTVAAPAPKSAPAIKKEERQEMLRFEPASRGRFDKSEPTIEGGEDLDVPTFLRRNVRVK
jgi:cell division protein FtsZ